MSTVSSKVEFWLYRLSTVFKSIKILYTLPKDKVDAFLNSYSVYDYDWDDEKKLIEDMGPNYKQEVQKRLVDWYYVLNHLCSIGQVEKMYIPPAIDPSASIIANQNLLEEMMCKDLGLKSGQKALDLGCGRGRVASHMAKMSGASIVGMNIDMNQLENGRRYAKGHGLPCEFLQGNVNDIPYPFADGSFDGIYTIQCVFSMAKDLGKAFKEIHRLLKPGGKFVCLEWVTFDAYDPKNPHHLDLMRKIKPLIGAIGTQTAESCEKLLKQAGFEILRSEDPSVGGLQSSLIEHADKFFTRLKATINFLVRCKILPAHFKALFERFTQDGDAFVEGNRLRLMTSSYYMVAQKKG
jgi:sterol 24-C-methyltransferase